MASLTLQDVIKPKKATPKVLKTIDEVPEPPAQPKQPKVVAKVVAKVEPKVKQIEKKEIKTAVYRGRKKRGR